MALHTLHPGARLHTGRRGEHTGALGLLLGAPAAHAPSHLLTAGHLFPARARGDEARVWVGGLPIATLELNLLDEGLALDVALLRADEAWGALAWAPPDVTGVAALAPGAGAEARAWLPGRSGPTPPLRVRREPMRAMFRSPVRADRYVLHDLLRCSAPISRPGDSGAPLLSLGGLALGLVVGNKGVISMFTPAREALDALEARLGGPLTIWPGQDQRSQACST